MYIISLLPEFKSWAFIFGRSIGVKQFSICQQKSLYPSISSALWAEVVVDRVWAFATKGRHHFKSYFLGSFYHNCTVMKEGSWY